MHRNKSEFDNQQMKAERDTVWVKERKKETPIKRRGQMNDTTRDRKKINHSPSLSCVT